QVYKPRWQRPTLAEPTRPSDGTYMATRISQRSREDDAGDQEADRTQDEEDSEDFVEEFNREEYAQGEKPKRKRRGTLESSADADLGPRKKGGRGQHVLFDYPAPPPEHPPPMKGGHALLKPNYGVWREAEHNRYTEAMELYRNCDELWELVANYVGTRSAYQVYAHFCKLKDNGEDFEEKPKGKAASGRVK
ncbi:hypothetical protein EON65_15760, partial [archaeon]